MCSCSYPLTKLPLPGNAPQQFSTPVKDYESPSYVPPVNEDIKMPRWVCSISNLLGYYTGQKII